MQGALNLWLNSTINEVVELNISFQTSCFCSQQAFNAAVAINHMKKLQQAHSQLVLRQKSIPDIKVTDVSSPAKTRKHPNPDKLCPKMEENSVKVSGSKHMPLPMSHVDLKSHHHPLKATQSQCVAHHAPTIAEQGKHVYHSEPANLNGFVHTYEFLTVAASLMYVDAPFFLPLRYGKNRNGKPLQTGVCSVMWTLREVYWEETHGRFKKSRRILYSG